jgi:hypothetical protein
MEKVEDSKLIRSKFGFFFRGGEDKRPSELAEVSVRNWVTHETRVRLAIMKVLGQRYVDANQGSKMKLVSYEPRPLLTLIPPSTSRDKKVRRYNFMEAINRLPSSHLTSSEIGSIMKTVGNKFAGKLRSLFVVVSDDMRRSRASHPVQAPSDSHAEDVGQPEDIRIESEVRSDPSRASRSRGTKRGGAGPEGQRSSKSHRS